MGEGLSFLRLAMARSAMPLFGPSLAGRSNSTTGTLTLTRWAAICAPITPAPSTATFFTLNRDMDVPQVGGRRSTRLNSSHLVISYAVFCLKKKKKKKNCQPDQLEAAQHRA